MQDSGKAIPLIVESCIRFINLYGGLFKCVYVFYSVIQIKQDVERSSRCLCALKCGFVFLSGLQHQGIFRVSGSQVEVNDIKNSFERGSLIFIYSCLFIDRCF